MTQFVKLFLLTGFFIFPLKALQQQISEELFPAFSTHQEETNEPESRKRKRTDESEDTLPCKKIPSSNNITDFSPEILVRIFSFLEKKDTRSVLGTCRYFHDIIIEHDPKHLWEGLRYKENYAQSKYKRRVKRKEWLKSLPTHPSPRKVKDVTFSTHLTPHYFSKTLFSFSNIKHLNLYSLSGFPGWELKKIIGTNISTLSICTCPQFKDRHIGQLFECPKLRTLYLSHLPQITARAFENSSESPIDTLDLSVMAGVDSNLGGFLPKGLKILSVFSCKQLGDPFLEALPRAIPAVEELRLQTLNPNLSPEGLSHLKDLPRLKHLLISDYNNITNTHLLPLGDLKGLKTLNISDNILITGEGLEHLLPLTRITSLDLGSLYQITDEAFIPLVKKLSLEKLDIRGCRNLSDLSLQAIGETQKNIKELSLVSCRQFREEALLDLKDCTKLEKLILTGIRETTNNVIRMLASFNNLKELYVALCPLLTDEVLEVFATNFPRLKYLCLNHCAGLSKDGIAALQEKRPNLKISAQ